MKHIKKFNENLNPEYLKNLRMKTLRDINIKSEIRDYIEKNGEYCDLNVFNTMFITDLSEVFKDLNFNGKIDKWDTKKVTTTKKMFMNSTFDGKISNWNVENVTDFSYMFYSSNFDDDISEWKVDSALDMSWMFWGSKFSGDLSKWKPKKVVKMRGMFDNSGLDGNEPYWYVFLEKYPLFKSLDILDKSIREFRWINGKNIDEYKLKKAVNVWGSNYIEIPKEISGYELYREKLI